MARTEIPIVVLDPATGNALSGASVAVALRSTGAAATIYAAETGGATVANPRTTDTYGRLTGWVERGAYTLTVTGSTLTTYVKNWDSAPAADSTIDPAWSANGNPIVTALPASPINGQECYFQSATAGTGGGTTNTMADVGAVWHLKYRSAAAGSFKWEFVGGATLSHQNGGGSTTTPVAFTTYAPSSWTSPTVKVPLAGSYNYSLIVNMASQTSGSSTVNYQNMVGSTTGALISQQQPVTPVNLFGTLYVGGRCGLDSGGNLVAGETLSYQQSSFSAGNAITVGHVRIEATPVRVG